MRAQEQTTELQLCNLTKVSRHVDEKTSSTTVPKEKTSICRRRKLGLLSGVKLVQTQSIQDEILKVLEKKQINHFKNRHEQGLSKVLQ